MPMHDAVAQKFNQLVKAKRKVDLTLKAFVKLSEKADMVAPDDVYDAVAGLVGKGFDAKPMAGMLATMPPAQGEALAGWVKDNLGKAVQAEQQLAGPLEAMRHATAVTAVKRLMQVGTAQRMFGHGGGGRGPSAGVTPQAPSIGTQGLGAPGALPNSLGAAPPPSSSRLSPTVN